MKNFLILCIALCLMWSFSGCSNSNNTTAITDAPEKISTLDEAKIKLDPNAVEKSENVNGMRYSSTLEEFSKKYNEMLKEMGSLDMINGKGWQKKGDVTYDSNGVKIQYYFYEADKISFTATVEVNSNKIMNIGLGTTISNFLSTENDKNNSDIVLMKSGAMAAAVCGYPIEKINILQDVFYRTTFENVNELWYDGNVYCLSTREDRGNSERSTMLFRVFPISDEHKGNWEIVDYEQYIATMPNEAD